MKFDFFIIGGDKRQVFLANFLVSKNFNILVYDLYDKILDKTIKKANSVRHAIKNSKNIILPIPFSRDFLFLDGNKKKVSIKEFLAYLTDENFLFGGCFTDKFLKNCKEKNVFVFDYYKDRKFVIYNSILTAEVAISKAVLENPIDMHSSSCLVLGFGNCGKLISNKLKNLCSFVFVCTDNEEEKALAKAYGFSVFSLKLLAFKIEKFNYIFNTIPKKIFNDEVVKNLNENSFVLDITKYGLDEKECREKGTNFKKILGIPGRYKAISSAKNLVDLTLKIIKKY